MNSELPDPEIIAPGGLLKDGYGVFAFEADFARDFRCIPMVVRFKLDRVGIKLSLKQWTKIGYSNRRLLAELPCNSLGETADYHRALVSMIERNSSGPIVTLPLDPAPSWADCMNVPDEVAAQASNAGVNPPTAAQWLKLDALQRFALVKLARSNHDNHNFAPAMCEFGIASHTHTKPLHTRAS